MLPFYTIQFVWPKFSKMMVFKNLNISKNQKFFSVICTFLSVLPLFILAFFFFFDRFLILLTFHLFCSSSSRHRLLVALNYLPIELDYPNMRFYITISWVFMSFMNHEPWNIDDDQNWACRITEYWTGSLKKKTTDCFGMSAEIHSPK